MKAFLFAIILLAALGARAEVVYRAEEPVEVVHLLSSTDGSQTIQFNLPALESSSSLNADFGGGTVFRIPSRGAIMGEVGCPDLPVIRRMVLVPATGNVDVSIEEQETQFLGNYRVPPLQDPPLYSGTVPPFRINEALYSISSPFPASPVEIESVELLRDVRVAWVRYSPVTIDPVTGDTWLTTSVTCTVSGTGGIGENENINPGRGYTRSFRRLYGEVVGLGPIPETDVVDGSYVFIGSAGGIDEVQDLIDWKAQKGYEVHIGLLSEIGSTVSEIDSWLENAFTSWTNPPEYVMLVGDANVVPSPQYSGYYTHAADNDYAVVGSGALPSMNIGRICGNDTDDLAYISWKIVQHETDPYQPAGENWFMRGFSMACTDFEAPEEALRLHQLFQANAIESDFYCNSLGGATPSLSQVVSDINEGRSVISYIGHGDNDEWVTSGFSNSDIASLTNGRRMPWVYTIGCQNGEFDNYYCFCEAFLSEGTTSDPRGAITIMGSSTYTPVGPGDTLQIHTFRGYFTEELHHLGAAHAWGKYQCDNYFGSSGEDMIMMAHLFGDPETDIYCDTAPIAMLGNSHSSSIGTGNFPVTVTDDTDAPVEGAMVAAYYADTGELLDSDHTDASGVANLEIASIPGAEPVTITSTAHNCQPDFTYATSQVPVYRDGLISITDFHLNPPVPNPMTSMASISFGISGPGTVSIDIYDLAGRAVASIDPGELQAGSHTVTWGGTTSSGGPVPGGLYVVRVTSPSMETQSRNLLVLR